jgi:hypothetical protein
MRHVEVILPCAACMRVIAESWLEVAWLPAPLAAASAADFDALWALHTEARGQVIMGSAHKPVTATRWHRSYGRTPRFDAAVFPMSCMFGGPPHLEAAPVDGPPPAAFAPFLAHVRAGDARFNQLVASWYGGGDRIASHADCEIGMVPDAGIAVLTLLPRHATSPSTTRRAKRVRRDA